MTTSSLAVRPRAAAPMPVATPAPPLVSAPAEYRAGPRARHAADDPVAERITAFLPLVRRIAWHVHGRVGLASGIAIEDLAQTGMVALVEAAQAFEDRGLGFAAYAAMRVRGAMIDLLRRQAASARSAVARRRRLGAMRDRLAQHLGHAPDDADMADAMGLTPAAYRALADEAAGIDEQSLDAVYSDQSPWFADQAERADDALARRQLASRLGEAVARLPERQAMVLQLYFVEELNLDEIGAVLGVGAARVCQIKKAALDVLRGALESAVAD